MNLSKRELALTGLIVILLIVNISLILKIEKPSKKSVDTADIESYFAPEDSSSATSGGGIKKAEIAIHITGQIKSRGVIYIPEGSRAIDAINAAGGTLPEADLDRINLARALFDGEKLHIPAVDEVMDNDSNLGYNVQVNARVNINIASASQLEGLQGIGPVLAQRIIDFRKKEGPFRKPEDLMKVSGIGPKVYENLKDSITVR